jgi:thiol:disulfide interchange protein DsbD
MDHPLRAARRRSLAILLAVLGFVAPRAALAEEVRADHVSLSAAIETPLEPGGQSWVALRQVIDPGWHTYWISPGDTGLATTVAWSLPPAVSAGAIAWPVPERIVTGPIIDFGYTRQATLLVPLRAAPSAVLPGARAKATVTLLECRQMCIPERIPIAFGLQDAPAPPRIFADARAALPQTLRGAAAFALSARSLTLVAADPRFAGVAPGAVQFFPATENLVDVDARSATMIRGEALRLQLRRLSGARNVLHLEGVIAVAGRGAFAISASRAITPPSATSVAAEPGAAVSGVLVAIVFAFLGGLVLNLMPCVLPILSMKALALARSGEDRNALRRDGIGYAAGVLATFLAMGGVLVALKSAGAALGWGFQLQSPPVVLGLAILTGAIGLNLLGAFEVPLALAGIGDSLSRREGRTGAFFTGALAVTVASPCTAPFMGSALAYAVTQPAFTALLVFAALGVGFALPFTLLTRLPGIFRLLPKPGPWMIRFREFLSFPMFATAIWLAWVLTAQVGPDGLARALAICLGLVFAVWLVPQLASALRWPAVGLATALALFTASGMDGSVAQVRAPAGWNVWSPAAVADALRAGRPVFVDFSAAWCVTCLVNERVALDDATVMDRFARDRVALFRADWTNRSAAIAGALARFGRNGVPLYVIYAPGREAAPTVLPQLLTAGTVLAGLRTVEDAQQDAARPAGAKGRGV